MDKRNLPDRYTDLREELKLSQTELATKLDVSKQSISAYENGDRMPSTDQLIKYANFFHVSTDYLLGLTDVKSANADIIAACEFTGLSEEAVQNLIALYEHDKNSPSEIIKTKEFKDIAVYLQDLEKLSTMVTNGFDEKPDSKELDNLILFNKECNVLKYLADNSFRKIIELFDLRNNHERDIG